MDTWEQLAAQIRTCSRCPHLAATRTHVVVGLRPQLLRPVTLIGEAPGAQEDMAGEPFVGRAGQLLDVLLAESGLDRASVAIVNVLKCRPPGNRVPTRTEVAQCRPWLEAQLEILDPRVIVTLGGTATAWFFGAGRKLSEVRGRVHRIGRFRVVPTYHPSAALRFGPGGLPRAALREDLKMAASVAADESGEDEIEAGLW